jgi:hypothetical protein
VSDVVAGKLTFHASRPFLLPARGAGARKHASRGVILSPLRTERRLMTKVDDQFVNPLIKHLRQRPKLVSFQGLL